ncbi:MAG: DNA repair protein RecN [Nocardioidaceae bacterium]
MTDRWEEIRLHSLGVIEDAALDLDTGFTVITGETGAGKTMVVTALGLLRGQRADSGLVRHGDTRTRVEARVQIDDSSPVADLVAGAGGELDDGALIVARTLSVDGRSRAFVGGASVPAAVLGQVSEHLVAVHGQSDQHRLLMPAAQRSALDRYAGAAVKDPLDDYRPAYARLAEVDALAQVLTAEASARARERDMLMFGLGEIESVDPQPNEDDALLAEEERLAHADSLRAATAQAHAALAGDDLSEPAADALNALGTARSLLDSVGSHDEIVAALAGRVAEATYVVADVASDLAAYASSVDADPNLLATVQARRAELAALTRKYGASVNEVLAWGKSSAARVLELADADETIDRLDAERQDLLVRLRGLAERLTVARTAAATELGRRATEELEALAMPHSRLIVQVACADPQQPIEDQLGRDGADDVTFLLVPNAGAGPRPLGKGASGGELSRIMLALEVVLADRGTVGTFVFDEVDAGVGGAAAVEVGRRLARLARRAQVIVVTHLPQVAVFADRHFRVLKSDDGTVTTSGVRALDEAGRVQELSRMLAGLEGSATAEAHARELIEVAAQERSAAVIGR